MFQTLRIKFFTMQTYVDSHALLMLHKSILNFMTIKKEVLDNDTIPQFLGFSNSENKESEPENRIVNEMSDEARDNEYF